VTPALAVSVLLVVVASVATVFVVRAARAIFAIREQAVALRKQTKQILSDAQRTNATAKRILDRTYAFQKQVDVVLMDPKVQAALNRHEEKDRG
jgi:hypothetical protein